MTKLEKIEQEIASLSKAEIFKLADWFAEFHADLWDRQMAEDIDSGRLDNFLNGARAEIAAGKVRDL